MVPFFGAKITQNTKIDDDGRLDRFTGRDRFWKPKKETENFASDIKKNSQNVFGKEVTLDFEKSRYVNERFVNNTLPFEQIKVGPGLDDGYTSKPSGGLQQANKREFELPKSIDELRYKTNPKMTYEGRVVDGQKGTMRGEVGEMCKNRVETFYELLLICILELAIHLIILKNLNALALTLKKLIEALQLLKDMIVTFNPLLNL